MIDGDSKETTLFRARQRYIEFSDDQAVKMLELRDRLWRVEVKAGVVEDENHRLKVQLEQHRLRLDQLEKLLIRSGFKF
jgi:hypothetical protein